jgi:hypothetical protein
VYYYEVYHKCPRCQQDAKGIIPKIFYVWQKNHKIIIFKFKVYYYNYEYFPLLSHININIIFD